VRRYLENAQESVHEAMGLPLDAFTSPSVVDAYENYRRQLAQLTDDQLSHPEQSPDNEVITAIEEAYQQLKGALLQAGAIGEWRVSRMEDAMHRISVQRRALQQLVKANRWLRASD